MPAGGYAASSARSWPAAGANLQSPVAGCPPTCYHRLQIRPVRRERIVLPVLVIEREVPTGAPTEAVRRTITVPDQVSQVVR
jgi:hypothetical protein